MPRSVEEWIGKTDDTSIPPRVRLRIFERDEGKCCVCGLHIGGSLLPAYDHRVSLINGGENRESNVQLLCVPCHKVKTGADVKEKSIVYDKKIKRLKLKTRRLIPGSKGSGIRRTMGGRVWRE